jgi:hypothetical protein
MTMIGEKSSVGRQAGLSRSVPDESLLKTFAETGIVRLHDVFSVQDAKRMQDVVWRDLYYTDGVRRDDPSTWRRKTPLRKLARAKRDPIFGAVFGEPLQRLADALLGEGWAPLAGGFGNLLVSFPDAEHWHLPGRDGFWHSDLGGRFNLVDPLPSLRIFAIFGEVPPGGGGTLLVAGSDRMITRYVKAHPDVERTLMADVAWNRDIPYLADLILSELPADPTHDQHHARRRRFMDTITDVDGIPAQVIEACGQPGDVYVCAPWTIHCKPPNASDRPRLLRAPTLFRGQASVAASSGR